jgi:hypothetical protein
MNITTRTRIAQARRSLTVASLGVAVFACGKKETATRPLPADPDAAVVSFLGAVRAEDLDTMGQLWGTAGGPASTRMDREELEQRLTIMKVYLEHEEYSIIPGMRDPTIELRQGERLVTVRLTRRGCTPTVPFTVTPYQAGWLIRDVKLEAAGNPARTCPVTP